MNLSPETFRAELKRLINEKVVASCWLFTSLDYSSFGRICQNVSNVKLCNSFFSKNIFSKCSIPLIVNIIPYL